MGLKGLCLDLRPQPKVETCECNCKFMRVCVSLGLPITGRQTERQNAENHTTQRDAAGPVMLITRDPRLKSTVGFHHSAGGIWCEEVIRMPAGQRDT